VHPVISNLFFQIWHQHIGVLKPFVLKCVKRYFDDVIAVHSFRAKMLLEKIEQQKGLSTATDAGNDLDKAIVFLADEFAQIYISFHYHVSALLMDIFAGKRNFVHHYTTRYGVALQA
jgi:hypothetical protein